MSWLGERVLRCVGSLLLVLLPISCYHHPEGLMPPDGTPPDSLRAKVEITIWDKGAAQDISATILAVPGKRYRAEFTGPLGVHVGSLLWSPESWLLVLSRDEAWLGGTGNYLALPGVLLPPLNIHHVMGVLWGAKPPEDAGETQVVGQTLQWYRNGQLAFRMVVKSRDPSAKWGEGAWVLEPPEGYRAIVSPQ